MITKNVDVINISLTGPYNTLLEKVINAAQRVNIPVVAAAGNSGPGAAPHFPAAYEGVFAVTAVDVRLRPYVYANRGNYISFAAPGVGVWTPTEEGGTYQDGTSFAAPFVTAAIASMQSRQYRMIADLNTQLVNSAVDLGAPGKDPLFGWGLLQAKGICEPAED